ncbi:MAG TPA: cardiolipin synthase ClsB [Burkholderiales bacterium]|nr:cardiolipin synthase ClsB [Burkholderiales bacterium]
MIRFFQGNRIQLLRNGAEYFPALIAACNAAADEIHLQTYIFAEDSSGQAVAKALMQAARRGVAVHLLLDGFGSKDLSAGFLRGMQQAGVQVLNYRPQLAVWRFRRTQLRRLHHKVAVVDGSVAFVGGINVIDDMDTPGQIPPRFDYAVMVEGPLLSAIHRVVTRLWWQVTWTQLRLRRLPRQAAGTVAGPRGGQRAAFVIRNNVRHRRDIENAYLEAIRRARSEVLIANAYFFPGKNFRRALSEAAARGVRVILLLQGRVEYRLLHYASRALYRQLLDAGIEIQEYHHSFMHAKVAVIDGHWATVGSSNIEPLSLLLAREANVVIEDAAFARTLRRSLEEAIAVGAEPVRRTTWRKQRLPARAVSWLCYEIVRLLIGWSSYGRVRDFT